MTDPLSCPPDLADRAPALMHRLQRGQHPASSGQIFRIQDWTLAMAGRLYYAESSLRSAIDSSQGPLRDWALCLGTRHCDGHVREACVRQLMHADHPWVLPFVVQLVGEYVVEIVQVVLDALPGVSATSYTAFVRDNPGFIATTRRRATSYWDCYYRRRYPALRDYPGVLALDFIERMSRQAPPRRP